LEKGEAQKSTPHFLAANFEPMGRRAAALTQVASFYYRQEADERQLEFINEFGPLLSTVNQSKNRQLKARNRPDLLDNSKHLILFDI
jgi:hypothetical protein